MSLGAKALQASAEAACPGAPLEQRGDMTSATGQSFKQRSNNHLTNAKRQPQTLAQQRSISKSQTEMNRNMLSYPQPSVPLRSLFYKLTYCSKSQIFRNSSGWRYYQEKWSVSANQCNWGILSRRLRRWWQKLENQNPREGEAQATQIHRQGAGATFDSASDVLFCQKQVRSLTKTFSVFWCKWCISENNQPHWPWSKGDQKTKEIPKIYYCSKYATSTLPWTENPFNYSQTITASPLCTKINFLSNIILNIISRLGTGNPVNLISSEIFTISPCRGFLQSTHPHNFSVFWALIAY